MKRFIKSLALVALFTGMTAPVWGQASTQGKEFWVSSTLVCSPDKATPTPYIAISAENACTITIKGGVGNAINITQQVAAGSWNEFGNISKEYNTNPATGPINVQMDASAWYPTGMTNANNVSDLAGQKNMYGLHVTATENISVYVILSSVHSMDASNILPITALGSEYYTQDYWSKVKSDFNDAVGLTTILGTEDNTTIEITPEGNTFDGWTSGSTHSITLNKGQTYYLVTQKGESLAGTHIFAKDGRKIAVYCGVPITNVPTGIAARDCLFEQPMPVEYWGTQFIVSRSLEKNGNLIGITASVNGTEIKVDGYSQAYINEGETYYIMLQNTTNPNSKNPGTSPIDLVITADVAYIETSCPCAVYSYDTGNSYQNSKDDTEVVNGQGDPSSVWVSPIQQKIGKITFGTCYTSKTKDHFLNVVTETATCKNTKLTAIYGATSIDKSELLVWQPVSGNPKYAFARAHIGTGSTSNFSVFRLENSKGFIATVYGNGEDESYAYSAGSAAVEQGVSVNGITFTNGYLNENKFCVDSALTFDAGVGSDEITSVDWDFGDVSIQGATPVIQHTFTEPDWHDVTATLYGHQACSDENDVYLGTVRFTVHVVEPTIQFGTINHECLEADDPNPIPDAKYDTIWPTECWEDLTVNYVNYGKKTYSSDLVQVEHSYTEPLTGETYPKDPDNPADYHVDLKLNLTELLGIKNQYDCDSFIYRHVDIVTCLDLSIENDPTKLQTCWGEDITIPYTYVKGDMGKATASINGKVINITLENDEFTLPTKDLLPNYYPVTIKVEDKNCSVPDLEFPITVGVNYPDDIFKYKFNNVLAVYKSGFGGNKGFVNDSTGYIFTDYEWHLFRNGQDSVLGNGSVLYLGEGETFIVNDIVYVVLTNQSGLKLPSCPQIITNVPDYSSKTNKTPARKVMINQRLYISIDKQIYDMYGQRVQ